jgi:poly(3-hydroxybutyrate) depolymerase
VPAAAQDELSPESMLDRYLHFPEQRETLRPKLLALGADKLAELIAEYPRPKAVIGETKLETTCPDGFTRPYWIDVPATYDAAKPAPLLVCLHGGVMAAPVDSSVAIMRWYAKYRGDRPLMILAASADCYETWMNAAWWRDAGRANVLHFVREAKLRLNIDPERVFVTGFSDGGSGSFSMAFNSPDVFAGYLPMCGDPLIPTTDGVMHAYTNLKGANVHAFNGATDPIYPGKEIEKLYKDANKQGASIDWFIHPEAGHDWGDPDEIFPRQIAFLDTWTRPAADAIDWTADRYARREWLSIDETGEMDKKCNKAKKPVPAGGGSYRIDLGIKVPIDRGPMDPPVVGRVDPGSIAAEMGVKDGDLVTACEGQEVSDFGTIRMLLSRKKAGDAIKLTVKRGGESLTFTGKIPKPGRRHTGRIEGNRASTVNVEVHDVKRFSVWVTREMLSEKGELTIKLNRDKIFAGAIEADPAILLDEFTISGERTVRYIARRQFDVADALRGK